MLELNRRSSPSMSQRQTNTQDSSGAAGGVMPSGCSWLNHPVARVLVSFSYGSGHPQGGSDDPNFGAPLHGWVWPWRSPMLSGHGKLVNLVQQTAAAAALSLGHPALGWVVRTHHRYILAEMTPVQHPPGLCWL